MIYHTCPNCGANLDPGERCDCRGPDNGMDEPTKFYEDPQMPIRYGIFNSYRLLFQYPGLQGKTSRETYGRFVHLHPQKARQGYYEARRIYPSSRYLVWIDSMGYGTEILSNLGGFTE